MERISKAIQLLGTHQKSGIKVGDCIANLSFPMTMWNMEDNFYLLINNEQSKGYYPNNSSANFKICLDQFINFTDVTYECALVDFSCTTINFQPPLEEVYICLNIVSEQLIGGSRRRLARRTTVKRGRYQMEKFQLPFYVPIKPVASNMLEVHIKGADGKDVSFLKNTTTCTFHLRRKKKLWPTT